jgi:hypothetical protein
MFGQVPWRRLIDRLPRCAEPLSDDQEDPLRLAVGLDAHELLDQRIERLDPVLGRAAIKDPGAPRVPRGQVAKRALAVVLVLDQLAVATGLGALAFMDPGSRLDRGFLVRAHHEIAGFQQLSLPAALVQVEDPTGLLAELRVTPKDPGAIVPGTDRVRRQPPPYGHARDPLDDPAGDRLARQLSA